MEHYEQIKRIGQGTYGVALLVKDLLSGQPFVVKRINMEALSEEDRGRAMREVVLLANLRHPCIVVYHDSFFQDGELHIVMQYCEGGDLSQKMKEAREVGRFFGEAQIIDWLCQLCLALGFIHQRRVLHRDLKSQNVFLTRSNRIRLGDFGVARVLDSTVDAARTTIGTPYFLSPEAYRGAPYNQKSDMWALGCLLYEICALKRAFDAPNLFSLMKEVVEGSPPPLPSCFSENLRGLVDRMLSKEPEDRYTADEILMLPFVAERLRRLALKDPELLRVLPKAVAAAVGLSDGAPSGPPPLMTPGGQAGLASPAPPSPSHTVVPREILHRGDAALADADGAGGNSMPPGAVKTSSRGRLHLPARVGSGRRDSATSVGGAGFASQAAEPAEPVSDAAGPGQTSALGPLRKTSNSQQQPALQQQQAGGQSARPAIQTLSRHASGFAPQPQPPLRVLGSSGEEAAEAPHSPTSSTAYTPVSAYRESGGSSSYSPAHASGLSTGGGDGFPAAAGEAVRNRRGTADSDTGGFGGGRRPTLEPLRHGSMGSDGAFYDAPSRKGSGASMASISSPSSAASGGSASGSRISSLAAVLSARQAASVTAGASARQPVSGAAQDAPAVAQQPQAQPQARAFFPPSPRDGARKLPASDGSGAKGGAASGPGGAHLYTGLESTDATPEHTPRGLASDGHHAPSQYHHYHAGSGSSSMAPGTSPARSSHGSSLNRPRSFYELGPSQPSVGGGGLASQGLHARPPSFHGHIGGMSSHSLSFHERVSEGTEAVSGRSLPGSTAVSRRASRVSMGMDEEGMGHPHAAALAHLHSGPSFHGHPYGSSSSSPAAVSRGSPYEELGGGRASRDLSPRPSRDYHAGSHYPLSRVGAGAAGGGPDPWLSRSSISATVSAARREGGSGTSSVTASPPGPGSHEFHRAGGWDAAGGGLDPLALPEALEVDDSDTSGSPQRGSGAGHHGSAGASGPASAAGSRRASGIGRSSLFGGDSGSSPSTVGTGSGAGSGGVLSTHYAAGGRVSRRSSAVGFGSAVPSRKGSGSTGPDGGLPHPSQYYHLQPSVERVDEDDGDDDRPAGVEMHSMLLGSPGRQHSPTALGGRHDSRRSSGVADTLGALASPRPTVTSLPARSPPQHLPPARLPHLSTGSLSLHGAATLASPSLTQQHHRTPASAERGAAAGEGSPNDAMAAAAALHSGSPSKSSINAPHFTPRPFHFPSSRPGAALTPTSGVGSPSMEAAMAPVAGSRNSLGSSSATGSPSLAGLAQPPPFRRNSSGFSAAEEVGALPLPAASPRPASLSERYRRQSLPHLQAPGPLAGSPAGSPLPRSLAPPPPLGTEPPSSSFLMSPSAFGHQQQQQAQGGYHGGRLSSDSSPADAPHARAGGGSLSSSPLASSVPPPRLQVPPAESPPSERPSRDSASNSGQEVSPTRQSTVSRGSGPSSATPSKLASPLVSPAVDAAPSARSSGSSSVGGGAAWQQVAAFASQPLPRATLASPSWAASSTSNNATEGGGGLVSPPGPIQPLLSSSSSPPEAVWTPPNLALGDRGAMGGSGRGLPTALAGPSQLHTRLMPFTPAGGAHDEAQFLGIQEDLGAEDAPGLSIYPAQAGMFVIHRGGRRLAPLSAGGGHPNTRTSRVLPGGIVGTPVAPGPFVVAGTAPSLSRQSTGTMPTSATAMESPAASLLFRAPFSPSLPAATPRGLGGMPPLPGRPGGLVGTKAAPLQRLTLPSVGASLVRDGREEAPLARGLPGIPSPARADTMVGGGAGGGGLPPLGGLRPTTGLPMLRKGSAGTLASLSSDSHSGGMVMPAFGGSAAPSRQLSGVSAISSASSDAEYSGSTLRRPWTVGHATLGGLGGVTSSPGGVEVYDAIVSGGAVAASPSGVFMSRQNSDAGSVTASPWWEAAAAAASGGAASLSLDVDLPLSLDGTPVSTSKD